MRSCPTCASACRSERTYSHVMRLLNEYNVDLSGILLKPNMCLPGGQLPLCGLVTPTSGMNLLVALAGNLFEGAFDRWLQSDRLLVGAEVPHTMM